MAQFAGGGSGSTTRPPAVVAPKRKQEPSYGISGITAVPKAPSTPPPTPSQTYTPSSSGGGAGYGSSPTGQISQAAPTPPPRPPSLADFLGSDSVYTQQMSALDKARADYLAQQGQAKTQYLTGYTGDLNQLNENRTEGLGNLENDFASRGLLRSGLYADDMAHMNKDFDTKQSNLEQAKANFIAQLAQDLTNFSGEQDITRTKAKSDAAARRAAQYGL